MMRLPFHIKHIFFLGIGGIGMSALARYFKAKGVLISGYDKTPTSLTEQLIREGMDIHFEDDPKRISPEIDLVVYTPAVPKDLLEFIRVRELGLPLFKRAEVLGMITQDKYTIAVAGTHGKTTITSMIAHLLKEAGVPVTALLGGISKNYGSNYIASDREEVMVVEADEYDRSFLQLSPDLAVISSMDADHLDIYQSREGMLESFRQFSMRLRPGGHLVYRADLRQELPVLPQAFTYAVESQADYNATGLAISNGKHSFTLRSPGSSLNVTGLGVPGRHNVENAAAAAAISMLCGVQGSQIAGGLSTYRGVVRRFDVRVEEGDKVYVDDYAHHPRELRSFIESVKEVYAGRSITGVFQPHLYSRTRDFADGFAESLDLLDEAIVLDIYPAREKPIPGVSSCLILEKMHSRKKLLARREELLNMLDARRPKVLLTMGAGDIDLLAEPIEKLVKSWTI